MSEKPWRSAEELWERDAKPTPHWARDGFYKPPSEPDFKPGQISRSEYHEKTGRHLDMYGREPLLPKGCFVATAVYGSYDCPEVVKLRDFRDNFLKKYTLGRSFIAAYYRFGPYLAKMVKGRAFLSTPTKAALDLFIRTFLEKKRP